MPHARLSKLMVRAGLPAVRRIHKAGTEFEKLREVARVEYPIPKLFESGRNLVFLRRDPRRLFPDDAASRWMLSLLAASHDIGLTMKTVTPFLIASKLKGRHPGQYRFSHMFYFWRLWLSHVHEAWLMYNRPIPNSMVTAIKNRPEVREAFRDVCKTRGRRIVNGISAGDLMEKCRNITFHYDEREGDDWPSQLKRIPKRFPLCIVEEGGKSVDARWLIADEYMISRLNKLKFGSRGLQRTTSRLTHQIIRLIRLCQAAYFDARKLGVNRASRPKR